MQVTPASVTVKVWPAIVTVPVRLVDPVFAATLSETVPLPLPDAPAVTVIHASLLTAVQAQADVAVTVTLTLPPPEVADWLAGEMLKEHAAAACVTAKDWPPAVIVALRLEPAVLAATLYPIVPLPDPDPPLVTLSHDWLLVAVQEQPAGAAIAKLDAPPAEAGDADPGVSANEHEIPASVTVKVWPAIVTVPVRELVDALAATVTCTVPLPLPEVPELTVIHEALLVAVHAQAVVAVTVMV